jgi:hypothetical protein
MNTVEKILREYFVFDQIFDLIEYAPDMGRLHSDLLPLIGQSYEPNYRFIFKFDDTDYHITLDQPGLTLRNLQRILCSLDISNYFALIITTNSINKHLLELQKEISDAHPISSIQHVLKPGLLKFKDKVSLSSEKINKCFVSLNGRERDHRKIWVCLLKHHDLLDRGIVSFGITDNAEWLQNQGAASQNRSNSIKESLVPDQPFLYPDPFSLINNKIIIKDEAVRDIVSRTSLTRGYKNFHDTFGLFKDNAVSLLQQAFVNVVTETVCHYPNFYLSEKTFKPISSMRPFLMIAPKNTLAELKKLGFKTFDRWWDEKYDELDYSVDRILAILDIIKGLSTRSIAELQAMCNDMKEVLEYNYTYYQDQFYDVEIKKFHNSCNQNLNFR